jgi:hypothetical protein
MVTHDDKIGIIADHHDGILQRLPLGGTTGSRIREAYDTPSEPVDRSFETQAGAGGRLKEKRGTYFSLQQVTIGLLFKSGRTFKDTENILPAVIINIYQTFGLHGSVYFVMDILFDQYWKPCCVGQNLEKGSSDFQVQIKQFVPG